MDTTAARRTPAGARSRPGTEFERSFWDAGCLRVAGVDEVGRGPLAGPAVCGAVVLRPGDETGWAQEVNDSKMMSPASRDRAAAEIRARLPYGLGLATVEEIDSIGIAAACRLAMRRAVSALTPQPDALLVDAFRLPSIPLPQQAIVHGDSLSLAIAAASIVAKVERDALLRDLDRRFPGYGLARHKGYGTAEHLDALRRLGPSPIHRRTFAPVREGLL